MVTSSADSKGGSERTGASGSSGGGFRVQLVWQAIRRHPLLVLLLVMFAGATAAAAWLFLPLSKRTGVTVFHVASQPLSVMRDSADSRVEFTTYKNTQAALVKQRLVLNEALKHPDAKDLQVLRSKPDPLGYLEQSLQVDFRLGTELMRVTIEGMDEAELVSLLTAVSKAYMDEVAKKENALRTFRRGELEKRQRKYAETLGGQQRLLASLSRDLQSGSPAVLTVMADLSQSRLRNLQQDILTNERELVHAEREAQFHQEKADKARELTVAPADIDRALQTDTGIADRARAVTQRKAELADLDRDLVDKSHQRLVEARKRVADAEADLDQYRKDQRPKVAEELKARLGLDHAERAARAAERVEVLRKAKDSLATALEEIKRDLADKSALHLQVDQLRQEMARTERLQEQIVRELDQMELERGVPLRVAVSEEPYVMGGLEGNKRMKMSLIAAVGALGLGLAGLVFWESRTRRVRSVDDLGKGLGLKVFGTVPAVVSNTAGSPGREAALMEAIDTARTMLLYGAHGGPTPKTVLVTSALPGEGKTSLTGHLAISLTRAGYKTLLIDADLRNPSNHVIFNLPDGPGLSEFLRGEADQETVVRSTPFSGLSVLPAGRWTLGASQALAGHRWAALRAAVEAEYDFVMIDSAPILPIVDSLLLARHVDGVLLSVMTEHSTVASVAETQYRLLSTGANVLGVVLNGISPTGGRYGYVYRQPLRAAESLVPTPA